MNLQKSKLIAAILAAGHILQTVFSADSPQVVTSSPKGTVKGVFELSIAGDFDGMKKLFVTPINDKEKELLAEGFSDDLYVPAFTAACLEKFPDAQLSNPVQVLERAKAGIDKMVEKIDGDTATLATAAPPGGGLKNSGPFQQPIVFKKIDGAWKMAITENIFLRLPPSERRALHKARCDLMLELIRDVKAGKYASHEAVKRAMNEKSSELHKKFDPAPSSSASGSSPSANPLDDPNLSEDDKKAAAILKAAFALLEQKKVEEADAKILEVFPLKPKLSAKVRAQVSTTIVGLGFLDPGRATKIGSQWEKL